MGKSLALFMVFSFFSISFFGQKVIEGQVIDAETKEPLISASIALISGGGVSTDLEGFFTLETDENSFEVRYIGYETIVVHIDKVDSLIIIELQESTETLPMIILPATTTSPVKLSTAVSQLSKKDLQINNETSIVPSLNRVPGVFMHSGALNTNRITIRGIGNRSPFGTAKIKAYIDNIPLTNGSGETTIEDIDLSTIDQVNVFKGPTSSLYGAGLGGMINLKTTDVFTPITEISLKSTHGSYGLVRHNARFANSKDGKNQLIVNINKTESDGYRENNKYNREGVSMIGKFKLSEKESITVLGIYSGLNARIPSSLDSTDFANDPRQAAFTWARAKGYESTSKVLAGGSYTSKISDYISQTSSIFASFRNSYENRPFNILREKAYARGARMEWIFKHDFQKYYAHLEFRIGGGFFVEDYDWQTNDTNGQGSIGNLLSDNDGKRNHYNTFGQLKLDLSNQAIVTTGLNLNRTFYHTFDFQNPERFHRHFPDIWSPFLSLGYKLSEHFHSPKNHISLHALISHGFSPPTLEETLAPDGNINPDILPEQGWNFELGSRGRLAFGLNYNVSFYSMHIKDLLVAQAN